MNSYYAKRMRKRGNPNGRLRCGVHVGVPAVTLCAVEEDGMDL